MNCELNLYTALYEVEVNSSGRVRYYVRKSEESKKYRIHKQQYSSVNTDRTLRCVRFAILGTQYFPKQLAWFPYKAPSDSTKFIDPSFPAPESEDIVYIVPAAPGTIVEGTMMVPCNRVFMSESMFIVPSSSLYSMLR